MGLRNTATEWGSVAKVLHWLIAFGLFVLIYLGLEQAGHEFWEEFHGVAWLPVAVLIVETAR